MSALSQIKTLRSEVQGARRDVKTLSQEWASATGTMASSVEEARAAVDAAESQVDEALGRLREKGDGVAEELLRMTDEFADGPWKQALKEALLALTDGKAEMFEVRRVFGQVEFIVDGMNQKLSSLLVKMDPNQYQDKAQAIRQLFEKEALGIDQAIALLDESVDAWGKSIVKLYQRFKEGKASINEVIREAERARKALGPDSQTGALAEGVEDLLRGSLEDLR